jgi:hypothetical protein
MRIVAAARAHAMFCRMTKPLRPRAGVVAGGGVLAVVVACSGSSHGGNSAADSGSPASGDAGFSADSGFTLDDAPSDGPDPAHVYPVCVTTPDGKYMQCGGFRSSSSPSGSVCLGGAFCGNVPFTLTYIVKSGFPVPLTATLWRCDSYTATTCVPPKNEGNGNLNSVQLRFGAPNGALGPSTTMLLQQVGSSIGATCPGANPADATHFRIEDSYGNQVYVPFFQGGCCPPNANCQ